LWCWQCGFRNFGERESSLQKHVAELSLVEFLFRAERHGAMLQIDIDRLR